MKRRVTFKIRRQEEFGRQKIAQTFTAYLQGSNIFEYRDQFGPFEHPDSENQNRWQLDSTNDFWLHFEDDDVVHLDCRYDGQQPVIDAMYALFKANFAGLVEDLEDAEAV